MKINKRKIIEILNESNRWFASCGSFRFFYINNERDGNVSSEDYNFFLCTALVKVYGFRITALED